MNILFSSYIYVYLNPLKNGCYKYGKHQFDHEPFYIGKGSDNRINVHIREAKRNAGTNRHKTNTISKIKKSGYEPIRFKLYENITDHSANRLERFLIARIGRADLKRGPLTNLTDGGEGVLGYKHDENSKNKIASSIKLNWINSRYSHLDLRASNNPFHGKTHTEENRLKFSLNAKKTFTGKKQTSEHKKKKADAIRGEQNGMYGKSVLGVWIEKYGEDVARAKYEQFINDNKKGVNNPQYGKSGKNHAASKTRILKCPDGGEMVFEEVGPLKEYLSGVSVSYNTLRQYSKKGKNYCGYFLEAKKIYNKNKNN
jgi:hypothetical protein